MNQTSKPLKVKLISESTFTIKEHGVHTAFVQTKRMLEEQGVDVLVNSFGEADVTHIHTVGPYSLVHLLRDKKVVVSAHVVSNSFVGSIIFASYWLPVAKIYLKFFYNKADLVLAVAPKVKDELVELGVKSKIEIFPNPISIKTFKKDSLAGRRLREKYRFSEDDFIVLGSGQVQERKGVANFIETAEKLPKIKFVWVGGKPFGKLTEIDQSLEKKVANPPKNVFFLGQKVPEEMADHYSLADIFFLPSFQENAPVAVLEAAAVGLPLVLRDIVQYRMLYGEDYLPSESKGFADIIAKLAREQDFKEEYSARALELSK